MKRILALDIGDRRIGIALSDPLGILATPLIILNRRDEAGDIVLIAELVKKHEAGMIIAGLPHTLSGTAGHQAEKVQAFVENLKKRTDVPVLYRDESFTTLTARQLLRESGAKKKKEKRHDDAAAAAVLLQAYLDEKSSGKS